MKQNGFTLAEILVSLTVVGVLAALTIPGLVKNVQKEQAGSVLGKSVEQLEVGFQNIIQTANDNFEDSSYAETLSVIKFTDLVPSDSDIEIPSGDDSDDNSIVENNFKDVLSYLGLVSENISTDNFKTIKDFDGTRDEENGEKIQEADLYKFSKSPASVCFLQPESSANSTDAGKMDLGIASVYIDVNGFAKGPNTYGKDIFRFQVKNSGHLLPYGADDYKTTCADGNITDGLACTARVVADGWKIRYY